MKLGWLILHLPSPSWTSIVHEQYETPQPDHYVLCWGVRSQLTRWTTAWKAHPSTESSRRRRVEEQALKRCWSWLRQWFPAPLSLRDTCARSRRGAAPRRPTLPSVNSAHVQNGLNENITMQQLTYKFQHEHHSWQKPSSSVHFLMLPTTLKQKV